MLDVLVVLANISEHVMHVVFGAPPFDREPSQQRSFNSSENVQGFVAAVRARVAHPPHQHLRQGETDDAQRVVFGDETDDPHAGHQQEKQNFN